MKKTNLLSKVCMLLLVFAILAGALVSCNSEDVEPEQTSSAETDTQNAGIVIPENAVLIYPKDAGSEIRDSVVVIHEAIRKKTGVKLNYMEDVLQNGEANSFEYEILIGYTNREETKTVMNEIGYYDYAIRAFENKLVITAHTKDALTTAVDVFCKELLEVEEADGASMLFLKEERTVKLGEEQPFFAASNPLGGYRIVYPQASTTLKNSANELAKALKDRYGVELSVVTDAEPKSEYEIVLGITSRQEYAEHYTGKLAPEPFSAIFRAVGNSLLIAGKDDQSTSIACTRFANQYVNGDWQLNFPKTFSSSVVAYAVEDADAVRSADTDIRVMSYNVLSKELSTSKPDFRDRQDHVFTTILNYAPDVIGLQEVSQTAWTLFEQKLGHRYGFAGQKTPSNAWSYTGLMWDKEKVTLIETQSVNYNQGNKRIRLFVWGLFERNGTGERFIVASTHWGLNDAECSSHAADMTLLVKALRTKYSVPVITVGDFNTPQEKEYYKSYLTQSGQTDTQNSSKRVVLCPDVSKPNEPFVHITSLIDHVTCTKDLKALLYKRVINEETHKASDHYPIYVDFAFQ